MNGNLARIRSGAVSTRTTTSTWNAGGCVITKDVTLTGRVAVTSRCGGRMMTVWIGERCRLTVLRSLASDSSMKVPSVADGSSNEPRNGAGWISDPQGCLAPPIGLACRREDRSQASETYFHLVDIFTYISWYNNDVK